MRHLLRLMLIIFVAAVWTVSCNDGKKSKSKKNDADGKQTQVEEPKETPVPVDECGVSLTLDDDDDDEEEGEDDTGEASGDPNCGDFDEEEEEEEEDTGGFDKEKAFEKLMNPPARQECVDSGKMYDRIRKSCHSYSLAKSFECTTSGIVKKFTDLGLNVKASGNSINGLDGYEIDQCGESGKNVIVSFYKKIDNGDSIGVDVKRLCSLNPCP